jgi:CIC family chloride channel protein
LLRETDELAGVKVEDIMTRRIRTVPSDMTVSQLLDLMAAETHIGYPVVNENGELSGIVTIEEASKVDKTNRWKTSVGSIARQNVDVCFPGETALDAFKKMTAQETGRVLVLDPADPKQLIGIISKRDLMHVLIERACKKR